MLYGFGRFLLPHLPLDRDTERVKIGDEVGLQYYRLQRIYSGEIALKEGDPEGVKSPTDVGTGKDDKEFGEAAFTVLSKAIFESIPPLGASGEA